jgi:hypothetical protein
MLQGHREASERSKRKAVDFFEEFYDFRGTGGVPDHLVAQWRALHAWFQENAHFNDVAKNPDDFSILKQRFEEFEDMLFVAVSPNERLANLDKLIENANL